MDWSRGHMGTCVGWVGVQDHLAHLAFDVGQDLSEIFDGEWKKNKLEMEILL